MEIKEIIKSVIKEHLLETNTHKYINVTPNKYVYHTSNPLFREKISKEGLIPRGRSESWLSDTKIDGEVIFAVNSDDKKDWWDSTYDDDIYQIDTSNIKNKWFVDPNFELNDKRIITFERIPIGAIKLIHKGSIDGGLNEDNNKKHYYTTSYPMSIKDFIKLEVKERDNYDIDEVKEWIKKYNIGKNDKLLWIALEPHIAARYQMNGEDWDNAKQIYNLTPNEFDVNFINANDGFLIPETDDGDGGFIFVFR